MGRRKGKKNVRTVASPSQNSVNLPEANVLKPNHDSLRHGESENYDHSMHQEVERQSIAIKAILDVQIEQLLTGIRLLRSYFDSKQLQTPLLQFFEENLPNLSIKNENEGQFEVQWKNKNGKVSTSHVDRTSIHSSLLHGLSISYPDCSTDLGVDLADTSLLCPENMQTGDLASKEQCGTQMQGLHDPLLTPLVTGSKISIGPSPKTLRLPKPGEMLLSVHGSPLGVYKEMNMEAISESEEG